MISFQEGWEATFGAAFAGAFFDASFFAGFLALDEEAGRVSIGGGEAEVLEDIAAIEYRIIGQMKQMCNDQIQNSQNSGVEETRDGVGNQFKSFTFIPKTRSVTCGRVCCLLINKNAFRNLI
jgi:hypothetical protein